MKFWGIFRFEFNYHLRHVSTWLLLGLFLLFGFLILRVVTLPDGTYLNAPGTIAFFTIFGSAIWVVIGGVVADDAAARDLQTRMHPLIYTTSVSKLSYLGARFMAALALNSLMMIMLFTGMLISFYGPGAKTHLLGPFSLGAYLSNYSYLAFPTVLAVTAIQFCITTLSGRAIASYIASVVILIFSQFGGTIVRYGLDWTVVGGLMDLLGTSIIAEMEGWTPIEKNTRLVALEGLWLWNRATWLGITALVLATTYFRFQMSHVTSATKRWSFLSFRSKSGNSSMMESPGNDGSPVLIPNVARAFSHGSDFRQVVAIGLSSFLVIAKSRSGLTLVALLSLGTGLFATEYMEWLGVPLFARTEEVLRILTPSLSNFKTQWIIIPLMIIFYAGELIWREREAGLSELSDTAPVREWAFLLGKFFGLALVIATWMAMLVSAGIINQLVMQYHDFEIDVYLKALFGIQLTNYLLLAILMLVVHVVVNEKYIAYMVAAGIYGFIIYASMMGVEHNMLIYAADPGWSYGDMLGFGPFIGPWLSFKFYWLSWGFLLSTLATLFWVRSKESRMRARAQLAQRRLEKYKISILIAVLLVVGSGGFVFYNTNVQNVYLTKSDRLALRAEYERRYGKYENTHQPTLARVSLNVEIYPNQLSAEIRGNYQLVNKTATPIHSIHLTTLPYDGITQVKFDRNFSQELIDGEHGYQMYSLQDPLGPGESVQLTFALYIRQRGFSNELNDLAVVANGSHITSDWMPIIGYHEDRRLREPRDRAQFGLPAREVRPSLYNTQARYSAHHAEKIDFEAIVGTTEDQIAVAPGILKKSWTKGDRKYFHYATTTPIHNEYAFFSARYKTHQFPWVPDTGNLDPVTIQIYHHPPHSANIDRMMKSAQASLAYYSHEFGPYPYSHFRVIERPGPGRGMHAEPMTIDYAEGYSLMNPKPGGLDLPYHIMSHEVAHQWWGFQLVPAVVEGSALLVESFATYSAMQVVEETLGAHHLHLYLSQMRLEYEVPRSRAAPPLLRTNDRFMAYRKGPFALFALRNYIGKDSVNNALRKMMKKHTSGPPLPTTLDFYEELKAVTPDSLQYLVHDLFAANTFWELETKAASAKKSKDGSWEVTLEVEARKVTVDSIGIETEIPMDDWVEIGVYAPRTEDQSSSHILYLQKHQIATGKHAITLRVPSEPSRAGIDPNHLLIDLDLENNTRRVRVEGVAKEKKEPSDSGNFSRKARD